MGARSKRRRSSIAFCAAAAEVLLGALFTAVCTFRAKKFPLFVKSGVWSCNETDLIYTNIDTAAGFLTSRWAQYAKFCRLAARSSCPIEAAELFTVRVACGIIYWQISKDFFFCLFTFYFPSGARNMSGRRIGNYVLSDYLGGGGFGSVFKAQDASGRIVAIKELHKKHT